MYMMSKYEHQNYIRYGMVAYIQIIIWFIKYMPQKFK